MGAIDEQCGEILSGVVTWRITSIEVNFTAIGHHLVLVMDIKNVISKAWQRIIIDWFGLWHFTGSWVACISLCRPEKTSCVFIKVVFDQVFSICFCVSLHSLEWLRHIYPTFLPLACLEVTVCPEQPNTLPRHIWKIKKPSDFTMAYINTISDVSHLFVRK